MSINVKTVIEKLTNLTKTEKINWSYLDNYPSLQKIINNMLSFAYSDGGTFYTQINDGYMVICEDGDDDYLYLIAVPKINARDNQFLNDEDSYQEELLRLHNLIKKQFPNTNDFIDDFLSNEF